MKARIVAMSSAMLFAVCAEQEQHVACGKPIIAEALSQAERSALAHTTKRIATYCSNSGNQCGFKYFLKRKLAQRRDEFLFRHLGRQVRRETGNAMDEYDLKGNFLRTIPGL